MKTIHSLSKAQHVLLRALAIALLAGITTTANAQVVFDEAIDGDLSDLGPSPTVLGVFGLGTTTIVGTLGPDAGGNGATNGSSDADIFTFTIAPGQVVSSFTTTRSGPGNQSFFGQASSSSIASFTENDTLASALDTGGLFTNAGTTSESLGGGVPATFGPGPNTFIFQETAAGPVNYSISFNVATAVPEPTSSALFVGLGLAGLARRRR